MTGSFRNSYSVDALVFDAYGTLFDVQSIALLAERCFPGQGASLAQRWRTKQLEYSWQQSLMQSPTQPRRDFAVVTGNALDHAAESLGLDLADTARALLLSGYLDLAPFADAEATLRQLAPRPRIILSNGTLGMLEPLVRASGLGIHLDAILSADAVDIYKPSPRVYQLAADHLGLTPDRVGFVSSNCWDAVGAKAFGFRVFWVNRGRAPLDRHGPPPDCTIASLAELPNLLAP